MNQISLTLFYREDCPFCQLVKRKLTFLEIPCILIPVKPNGADRTELIELSGQQSVPVLQDGDKVITDSSKILTYLDETYGSGHYTEMPSQKFTLSFCVEGSFDQVLSKAGTILSQIGLQIICKSDLSEISGMPGVKENSQVLLQFIDDEIMPEIVKEEKEFMALIPFNMVFRNEGERRVSISVISPIRIATLTGRADLIRKIAPIKGKLDTFFGELTSLYKEIS